MIDDPLMPETTQDISNIAFVSLGCPKNLVDSEKMLGTLASAGFRLVSDHDEADAIVVNTCGFLEASKDESVEVINEAVERKQRGDLKRVIVAGCLVQRHRAKMLEWEPGIDAMIGVFDRDKVIEARARRCRSSPRRRRRTSSRPRCRSSGSRRRRRHRAGTGRRSCRSRSRRWSRAT